LDGDLKTFGERVDFGRTADDYGRHRRGFPDEFFERLITRGIGLPGQTLLDLGTGTGTIARGFAQRGAAASGLDPSESMLAKARQLDEARGYSVRYVTGKAEALDFPAASFDVVTAGQCWHWFDRPVAACEALRVLRPGGFVVVAHFDWIPLEGNVVETTEKLILAFNPAWSMGGGAGIHPAWLADLSRAGFAALETFSFDVGVPYSHVDWRGRIRASAGVGGSLPTDAVQSFDNALAKILAQHHPEDPLEVHHRVWTLIGLRPRPGGGVSPIAGTRESLRSE
jgi:SAM-dependent methyltransferase